MRSALEFDFEGMIDGGEEIPAPGVRIFISNKLASDDILAHIEIKIPNL